LTRRTEFAACYEAGRRYFSKNFVLFVLFSTLPEQEWRLGLAVTKKSGSAVERNRIKRVLREFFRIHQEILPEKMHVVAIPKRHLRAHRVSLANVTGELLPLIEKIRQTLQGEENGQAS